MSSIMSDDFCKKLKDFSTILKQCRLSEGLTQKQVAFKIGITYQSYQAYERGIALPTLENFLRLCTFFDSTPNEMLGIT